MIKFLELKVNFGSYFFIIVSINVMYVYISR